MDGKRLVYASLGKLYRVSLKSRTALSVPDELFDFNAMTFSEQTAPY